MTPFRRCADTEEWGLRCRIATLVGAHPKAPEGFTEIRPDILQELERIARQALKSGQPLSPAARDHLREIRDIIG
jgi:hypothetical protein